MAAIQPSQLLLPQDPFQEAIQGLIELGIEQAKQKHTIVLSRATATGMNELLGSLGMKVKGSVWDNKPKNLATLQGYMSGTAQKKTPTTIEEVT